MTDACPLPRTIGERVVDATAVAACSIAFSDCEAIEINVWLHEHEGRSCGHSIDSWPPAVRAEIARHADDCVKRHAGTLIATTTAIVKNRGGGRNAIVLLHIAKAKAG